mgnify:CR=1 FL=1
MKFTKKFEEYLKEHYKEVFVIDTRGDGHYLQMHVVDPIFAEKSRLERSRHIFKTLGRFMKVVHALSVWGHTPEEWQKKCGQIEHAEYIHIA